MVGGHRPRLDGIWAGDDDVGTFVFEIGPHDDYLLLRPAVGERLPDPLAGLHCDPAPDLSLRPEPDGRALGVLRLVWGGEAGIGRPPEQRLAGLVAALRDAVLPDVAWDPAARRLTFSSPAPAPASGEATETCPATEDAPRTGTPMPADDEDDDLLVRAAEALEAGQYGRAERQAREALCAGDETAAAFLEAVAAARRADRHLRRQPRDAAAHQELGWALFSVGALEAAGRHGAEAVRLDPARGCAHALLGLVRLLGGDRPGAEAAHEQARALAGADDPHLKVLEDALRGDSPLLGAGPALAMRAA